MNPIDFIINKFTSKEVKNLHFTSNISKEVLNEQINTSYGKMLICEQNCIPLYTNYITSPQDIDYFTFSLENEAYEVKLNLSNFGISSYFNYPIGRIVSLVFGSSEVIKDNIQINSKGSWFSVICEKSNTLRLICLISQDKLINMPSISLSFNVISTHKIKHLWHPLISNSLLVYTSFGLYVFEFNKNTQKFTEIGKSCLPNLIDCKYNDKGR